MYNPSYLFLSRHNIYYFRYPIPCNLHPEGKRSDVKVSLETRNPDEALYISRILTSLGIEFFNSSMVVNMDYIDIVNGVAL